MTVMKSPSASQTFPQPEHSFRVLALLTMMGVRLTDFLVTLSLRWANHVDDNETNGNLNKEKQGLTSGRCKSRSRARRRRGLRGHLSALLSSKVAQSSRA